MSRRKQQNPKPLKYDDLENSNKQTTESVTSNEASNESPSPSPITEPLKVIVDEHLVKQEMESPILAVSSPRNPVSPQSQTSPSASLETLLGVPDEAPLKVERSSDSETFKILSSTKIPKGAGLDPLSAQKIDAETIEGVDNPQIVSFAQKESKVFFKLESKINCGWLKYLGEPSVEQEANLHIYFVGGKLWVEVIKPLEEGEQLIAEFVDPSSDQDKTEPVVEPERPVVKGEGNSFPCELCGIPFRNPNNLSAHRNHYCSKLTKNGAVTPVETPTSSAAGPSSAAMPQPRPAYMCKLCQFMSLKQSDIESHVREVHKLILENATSLEMSNSASEKTYCSDCEISFKRPESYQVHKSHYCKRKSRSVSPKSNISASPQPPTNISHNVKDLYQTVSIMDSHSAMAAAAAAMASGFSVGLPSVLGLPALPNPLPGLPLKLLQSPAIIAQAMENAAKAMGIGLSPPAVEPPRKTEETPLDLTNKNDIAAAAALVTAASKRSSESDSELSPPAKRVATTTPSGTPRPAAGRTDGFPKKDKINRPIFRCESCSIPFYKKDVYEAHKQHYCSGRVSNGNDTTTTKQEEDVEDERLVITFTCKQCGNNYRTREMFRVHQCDLGATHQLYSCEECDFCSPSQSSLREHMESHVKINVTYKCDLCGYRGNTMRGMRQHGRTHIAKNEEYDDTTVSVIEHTPPGQRVATSTFNPLHAISDVDEQLLRMKNEPYKKRRSRKHYQKSENMSFLTDSIAHPQHSPLQPNENELSLKSLPSPNSTKSSQSPLHNSSSHINSENADSPPRIKREPVELPDVARHVAMPSLKKKPYVCSCNASFSSVEVFEAHKTLYCPNKRIRPTTVTASS